MHPSTQLRCGLTASQVTWIQDRFFEVIRSGEPGSVDPETVRTRVTEDLQQSDNDNTAEQLLERRHSLEGEALAQALHIAAVAPCKQAIQEGRCPNCKKSNR